MEQENENMSQIQLHEKRITQLEISVAHMQEAMIKLSSKFDDILTLLETQPNLSRLEKLNIPDFEKYDGKGDPFIHLRIYALKMSQYMHDDKLMIQTFHQSLEGAALMWFLNLKANDISTWENMATAFLHQYRFNREMCPTRLDLQRMKMKKGQSFKSYMYAWRETASRVRPPLEDSEAVPMFIHTFSGAYYCYLLGLVSKSFSDLLIVGERVEYGVLMGKIEDPLEYSYDENDDDERPDE